LARINASSNFNVRGYFTAKCDFLKVLHAVSGVEETRTVFTYPEVCGLLSKYILANKDKFFDLRNIKIAFVENDLLGKAFGVRLFARCQITSLLRAQLVPYEEMEITQGVSKQDNEDTTNIASSSSGNEYTEENIYRVEYEVADESLNNKRRKFDFSDDSEIDNTTIKVPLSQSTDVECWGEVDEGETMDTDIETTEWDKIERKCLSCNTTGAGIIKYCSMCWQDRKFWVPRRKRRLHIKHVQQSKKEHQPNYSVASTEKIQNPENTDNNLCSMCFINPKNASFIHGQSSHQVCCYQCAKRIYNSKDRCPICRRKIEKITKNFVF
jgi:E3 ubiquitin-protein ligase Mdm2